MENNENLTDEDYYLDNPDGTFVNSPNRELNDDDLKTMLSELTNVNIADYGITENPSCITYTDSTSTSTGTSYINPSSYTYNYSVLSVLEICMNVIIKDGMSTFMERILKILSSKETLDDFNIIDMINKKEKKEKKDRIIPEKLFKLEDI